MEKKIIMLIIVGVVLFASIILGVVLINKNNYEEFDMSSKKQLANISENKEIITTMSNEKVISPNSVNEDKQEYILRENNGYISIYRVDENGKEVLIETTEIVVVYLPDADRIELSKGIKAFGKKELNLKLEDYE